MKLSSVFKTGLLQKIEQREKRVADIADTVRNFMDYAYRLYKTRSKIPDILEREDNALYNRTSQESSFYCTSQWRAADSSIQASKSGVGFRINSSGEIVIFTLREKAEDDFLAVAEITKFNFDDFQDNADVVAKIITSMQGAGFPTSRYIYNALKKLKQESSLLISQVPAPIVQTP